MFQSAYNTEEYILNKSLQHMDLCLVCSPVVASWPVMQVGVAAAGQDTAPPGTALQIRSTAVSWPANLLTHCLPLATQWHLLVLFFH